jgi:hypothetical protein
LLIRKFLRFYWTQKFITMYTGACHQFLSWATWIQCIPSYPTFLKVHGYILLYSMLVQVVCFLQVFVSELCMLQIVLPNSSTLVWSS